MEDFRYLFTALLWFLCKFIALGGIAFCGILAGSAFRKSKNAKAGLQ